jgi:hypothetical protein
MYGELLENAAPHHVTCAGVPIEGQLYFHLGKYLDLYKKYTQNVNISDKT